MTQKVVGKNTAGNFLQLSSFKSILLSVGSSPVHVCGT